MMIRMNCIRFALLQIIIYLYIQCLNLNVQTIKNKLNESIEQIVIYVCFYAGTWSGGH